MESNDESESPGYGHAEPRARKSKPKSKPNSTNQHFDKSTLIRIKAYIKTNVPKQQRVECYKKIKNTFSPNKRFSILSEYANPNHKLRQQEEQQRERENIRRQREQKQKEREEYLFNQKTLYVDNKYTCPKCKCKLTRILGEKQMRSADEPATLFLECKDKKHRFKIG